jgi:hypothetical protein
MSYEIGCECALCKQRRQAADRRAAYLIAGVAILCAAVVAAVGLMW